MKTGLAIAAVSLASIAGHPTGAAAAAPSTTYYAANTSGHLVQVTVNGAKVTKTTVLKKGNPETRQLSPTDSDGDMIAGAVADIDGGGTERMFTYNLATKKFYDLSALGSKIRASALYAGGAKVVYGEQLAHSFVIRTVAATGGTPTTVFTSKIWSAWDIAMTDNGKHLYMSATNANTQAGNALVFDSTKSWQRLSMKGATTAVGGTATMSYPVLAAP